MISIFVDSLGRIPILNGNTIRAVEPQKDYWVKVIDYDGTIIDERGLNNGDEYALPGAPSHEGITFDGWVASEQIINNTVTCNNNNIMIGARYKTTSGLNEFDIELTKATGKTIDFLMTGNKNWGDGTTDSATSHTYTSYGKYTITCDGGTLPSYVFNQSSGHYNYTCVNVRLSLVNISASNIFRYCYNLKTAIIDKRNTVGLQDAFRDCKNLQAYVYHNIYSGSYGLTNSGIKSVVIPYGRTAIGQGEFSGCSKLENIVLPSTLLSMSYLGLYGLSNLKNNLKIPNSVVFPTVFNEEVLGRIADINVELPNTITLIPEYLFTEAKISSISIPDTVETIKGYAFYSCSNLTELKFPSGISHIGSAIGATFQGCSNILLYDFSEATAVPTLEGYGNFAGINPLCRIVVPDSLYNSWIAASGWSEYSNYIYRASDVFNNI